MFAATAKKSTWKTDMELEEMKKLAGIEENIDDIPTQAIDFIDDMLARLPEQEQYGTQGDILRYILQQLQG
jgi:hypothetical protein